MLGHTVTVFNLFRNYQIIFHSGFAVCAPTSVLGIVLFVLAILIDAWYLPAKPGLH